MDKRSYEFDPCEIDGSNKIEETLDNWRPKEKTNQLKISQWRLKQNGENCNKSPGLDDLKKIMMHLKNKKSDSDIMKAFGIASETLVAIKREKYDPVDGISLDNQSKIYKEFERLEKNIIKIMSSLDYLCDILLIDTEQETKFRKILGIKKKKIESGYLSALKQKKRDKTNNEEE